MCIRLDLPKEAIKFIQRAVAIEGENASLHLKYVKALAYRSNLEWERAEETYKPIMKDETTILEYREMIYGFNKKVCESNLNEDPGSMQLQIDLYSHFKECGLVRPNNYDVNLKPYYDKWEGWTRDKVAHIVDLLKRVRFFNRFDDEALKMMLTKVTLRKLDKNSVLFFKGPEAAILLSG